MLPRSKSESLSTLLVKKKPVIKNELNASVIRGYDNLNYLFAEGLLLLLLEVCFNHYMRYWKIVVLLRLHLVAENLKGC